MQKSVEKRKNLRQFPVSSHYLIFSGIRVIKPLYLCLFALIGDRGDNLSLFSFFYFTSDSIRPRNFLALQFVTARLYLTLSALSRSHSSLSKLDFRLLRAQNFAELKKATESTNKWFWSRKIEC
jgi:hypothetical protein